MPANWPFRETVENYPQLAQVFPDFKTMLVFAAADHVQAAIDKSHIHHAYDGFHYAAGLWCRMNPDRAYVEALAGRSLGDTIPDNPANREPRTWMIIRSWGCRGVPATGVNTNTVVALAAVAEMCDRTYYDRWDPDLDTAL